MLSEATRIVLLLFIAGATGACGFGVGAGVRYHPVSVSDPDGLSADVTGGSWSASMFNHEITIYDRTGLLLAGLATAGNRYNAAQDALADAAARGVKPGTEVPYTYQVHTPVPGMFTRLTFSWGSTDEISSSDDKPIAVPLDYLSMDLRTRVLTWPIADSRHMIALDMGVHWTEYVGDDATGLYDLELWSLGIPIGVAHAFAIDERFVWSSRVTVDPVMSLIALLVGGGLPWEVGTRLDCAITKNIFAFSDVQYRSLSAPGTGKSGDELTVTFGVGFVTDLGGL